MLYFLLASILLNLFFGFFCIKFALIILRVQTAIEESLDKIDEKFNRVSEISNIPVFYDSPEIKNIIVEIRDVKFDILEVARTLTDSVNFEGDVENKNEIE